MEKKESAKDRILLVATDLFYREGIRAVGIDKIIAESGVAKASFYRSFATKDDLIVAFIEVHHQRIVKRIEEARTKYPDNPGEQLSELFRSFASRIQVPDYRGCPFMNTVVEFPDASHPGHARAKASRLEAWQMVAEITREAGADNPEELSAQLEMLYSGAVMCAYLYRSEADSLGRQFFKASQLLLKERIPEFVVSTR